MKFKIKIAMCLYLVSGVLQPMIVDHLRYSKIITNPLYVQATLANVFAMALTGLMVEKFPTCTYLFSIKKEIFIGGCLDLLSGALCALGLHLTGSGVFVVCYSSVSAWTALLSYLFLNVRLNCQRICGVLFVCLGLAINALSHFQKSKEVNNGNNVMKNDHGVIDDESSKVLLGSGLVILGSLLHSAVFVNP
eukprot:Awhi_evm3s11226